MCFFNTIFLISLIVFTFLFLIRKRYSYWSDRNVPFSKPEFPYGFLKGVGKKYHQSEKQKMIYDRLKNHRPFIGLFTFINPTILITDLDFVKTICVKDFPYFMNRGLYANEEDDPITAHLGNIEDEHWKTIRTKFTPGFTSVKIKTMFPTILFNAEKLNKCLSNEIKINSEFPIKEILGRFAVDVITNITYGIDCNSLENKDDKFYKISNDVIYKTRHNPIFEYFVNQYRNIAKYFHIKVITDDVTEFFTKIVKNIIDYRAQNNDKATNINFLNLILQYYNNNKKTDDSNEKFTLNFNQVLAQSILFFFGGFDSTTTALLFTVYELSKNEEIQEKARREIIDVISNYNGEITYEGVSEMKYIEQILKESLRKYPPIPMLVRCVKSNYKVPGTEFTLEKDTSIYIPTLAIHHDPNYYSNPEKFNPDRFSEEENLKRHPCAFLSFGDGPRSCIGQRFATLLAKVGIIVLLLNFKFSQCSKSVSPIKFAPGTIFLKPLDDIWLKFEKIP